MSKGPYYAEGDYLFRVTDQGFGETKNGVPFFFLRGTPTTLLINGNEEMCEKQFEREITKYLSDKAVEYTIKDLRALGWEGESFKELDPTQPNSLSWVGQSIRVYCEHETNDAGTWERWNLPYVASDKPAKAKSDVKIASKLDALFGKLAKETATKKSKPAARPAVVQSGTGANVGEEIPF